MSAAAGLRLTSWLVQRGGLREHRGELRHILGRYKDRPGLVSRRGSTLDDACVRAWEEGYFPLHGERPTIDELLDAIREDLHGRKVQTLDETLEDCFLAGAEEVRPPGARELVVRAGRQLWGDQWQREMARALGVNERTVRRWAAASVELPATVLPRLRRVIDERVRALGETAALFEAG